MFSPKQKSKLINAVHKQGLDLSHFTVPEENRSLGLVHNSTGFCFYIEVVQLSSDTELGEQLIAYYRPDYKRINLDAKEVNIPIRTWDEGITYLYKWLTWVREECVDEQIEQGELQRREDDDVFAQWNVLIAPSSLTHLHPAV